MSESKHKEGLYILHGGDDFFIEDCDGKGTWTGLGYQTTEPAGEVVAGPIDEERLLSCVNACAGMTDPVEEVRRLREACETFLRVWGHAGPNGSAQWEKFDVVVCAVEAALGDKK